ncbi:response regulator receiver protein [Pseudolabrys taiwanensis]|uniref:Response regulator receiver protein n=1 Tax=Pseudolabrys taiwanensis TaxID=331696 RepID=A0A346A180_9HYPH|nr:AAA family ATPase [Pseudolabrys taiwanensis]AXK82927.1 response regulator receiver protein [Pseudolabrys taiwanensis]
MTDTLTIPTTAARPGATTVQVFVPDTETAATIRQALGSLGVADAEFVSGNAVSATERLSRQPSPRLLIVDVSGLDNPADAIDALAEVCEPNTGVIVVGDRNDIVLYRELKQAGVFEYFFKPVVGTLVTRACSAVLTGNLEAQAPARTGKVVFVLGVRGGVGATTIAVNTAWYLAEARQRWVMLVDLDMQGGDAALQLDVSPSHALREALEHPERVDKLFLERAAIHIDHRIDLLASLESIADPVDVQEAAFRSLLDKLLNRYRFIFIDLPPTVAALLLPALQMPSTCVLVSNASLACARDMARWREWIGPNTPDRSTVHVLNQHGAPGSLPDAEFARAAGRPADIVIPYDKEISTANMLGIKGAQQSMALKRGLAPLLRHLSGEQVAPSRPLLRRLFG